MAHLIFGPTYNSWAFGNESWSLHKNLPSSVKSLFEDRTIAGSNLQWGSLGPGNLCYFAVSQERGNRYSPTNSYRTQNNPQFLADLNTNTSLIGFFGSAKSVEFVAFTPSGGWIVFFDDQTLRVSQCGVFPPNFKAATAGEIDFSNHSPQYSNVKYAFFGAETSWIFTCHDNTIQWSPNLPQALKTRITANYNEGRTLTNKTQLCPWNLQYFFAAFEAPFDFLGNSARYSWLIWPNGAFHTTVVKEVCEGSIPASLEALQLTFEVPPQYAGVNPFSVVLNKKNPFAIQALSDKEAIEKKAVYLFTQPIVETYRQLFESFQAPPGCGYVVYEIATNFFEKAAELVIKDISKQELGSLWDATDANKDGKFEWHELLNFFILLRQMAIDKDVWEEDNPALKNKPDPPPNPFKSVPKSDASTAVNEISDPPPAYSPPTTQTPTLAPSVSTPAPVVQVPSAAPTKSTGWNASTAIKIPVSYPSQAVCDICCATIKDKALACTTCGNGEFGMCLKCSNGGAVCPGRHEMTSVIFEYEYDLSKAMNNMDINPSSKNGDGEKGSMKENDKQLRDSLMSAIITEKPNVQWDDVAGLDAAKEELQEAVVLPIKFPELFTQQRKARRGILLYGPPGTGKSFLAKAVATEVESTLFSISASSVVSKWSGESERLIKLLFQLAREKKPSIIFIDEIDSLCGARDAPDANALLTGLKTELLVQMDGVGNDNEGVLLLGATNLPWALDPAVRRRFQRKLHIPLPDERARRQLFKISSGKIGIELSKQDYIKLGMQTRGLSGSDISNAFQDALMVPIKKVQAAKHYRKIQVSGKELFTPCKPDDEGAIEMTWRQVPRSMLKEPPVERDDIFTVMDKVKPSVSQEDIAKCADWTEKFGAEGA